MNKEKPNIKCTKCGYQWHTHSKLKMVTCPSCNQKIRNTHPHPCLIENFLQQKRGIIGLDAAIILIAFVIIAAVFSFMVINQGVFATKQAKQYPAQLSGGQMQRVAIARALTNRPTIIFADEPTGDLDSVTGKQVMELLKKFHEETKTTIVVITHERDIADYAERQITLEDGVIKNSAEWNGNLFIPDVDQKAVPNLPSSEEATA
jgi:flagellin-like protein